MNRKISVGMTVTIVILAMTVTFSITMLMAMRLFDHTVTSVKEKESMYNKVAEVDRYVRANDYYDIDETVLYDRLTAGYLLPLTIHGFFPGEDFDESGLKARGLIGQEPSLCMMVPILIFTAGALLFGCFPGRFLAMLESIAAAVL